MTTIEYLALPTYKRFLYKLLAFFEAIPKVIWRFLSVTVVRFFAKIGKGIANYFINTYEIFISGDWKTKLSYFVMGFGHLSRKSYIKGFMYLLYEIIFIFFMVSIGVPAMMRIGTFGYVAQTTYIHPTYAIEVSEFKDDSLLILLNFVIALIFIAVLIFLWSIQIIENRE